MSFDRSGNVPLKASGDLETAAAVPSAPVDSSLHSGKIETKKRFVENLLFMVILLLFGTFLMTQIRDGISMQEQLTSAKEKHAAYLLQLDDLKNENDRLKEQNTLLAAQKNALTESVLNEQGYSELAESLAQIRGLAGFTIVEGAGVTITLSDSTITDTTDINQSSLIHSQDVQYFVDLLKAAGAKAIAINGDRIVCTTSIICTGPTIRVNNSRYPVPFVITAVCDPNTTYDILQNDSHALFRISEGVEIAFKKNDLISIPAFSDLTVIDALSKELEVKSPT
jgi:uncharacterized protein YlxW (UPF0749 family)